MVSDAHIADSVQQAINNSQMVNVSDYTDPTTSDLNVSSDFIPFDQTQGADNQTYGVDTSLLNSQASQVPLDQSALSSQADQVDGQGVLSADQSSVLDQGSSSSGLLQGALSQLGALAQPIGVDPSTGVVDWTSILNLLSSAG